MFKKITPIPTSDPDIEIIPSDRKTSDGLCCDYTYMATDIAVVPMFPGTTWKRPNIIAELMQAETSVYRYHRPKIKGWVVEVCYPFAELDENGRISKSYITNIVDRESQEELLARGLELAQEALNKYRDSMKEWENGKWTYDDN